MPGSCWARRADTARPETLTDTLTLIAQGYEATGRFANATIDAGTGAVVATTADRGTLTSYGENLHLALQGAQDHAARQTVLDALLAGMADSLDAQVQPAIDPTLIFPVIRHRDYVTATDIPALTEPFLGDLLVFYVLDLPNSMTFLDRDSIFAAGLDRADLRALALASFEPVSTAARLEGSLIGMVVLDGDCELSLL